MLFGLLSLIIIAAAIGFAFLAGRSSMENDRGSLMKAPPSLSKPRYSAGSELSPDQLPEIKALMESGNKIEAIKRTRELTGLGLKEAKDLVERL